MLAQDFLRKDDRGFTPTSSTRSAWYFALLIVAKFLRCIGIFIIDTLAKQVHVVGLLWLFKFVASLVLIPLQKPFMQGKVLRRSLHLRILQLSLFNCIIEIIWFYGITFCGPLRSILIYEQSPSVVLIALLTIVKGTSTPSKTRGLLVMGLGYLSLVLMDRDQNVEADHRTLHSHQSILNHLFYHFFHHSGVSDHKGGLLLLVFALFIKMPYDSSFRHLAVEIGGPKRLYCLTTALSLFFLTPLALLAFTSGQMFIQSYLYFLLLLLLGSLFVMVFDFYAESFTFQHVADPVMASARWSPVIMFTCAFAFASAWYNSVHHEAELHVVSGGVILTLICFIFASFALTSASAPRSRGGHYVGLSESGLPLYTYGEAFLQKTSRSIMLFVKETLSEILAQTDSRRIFWFLCANLSFCGIEFLYGFWTNSLGLISDGFHMLFDCSALVMGLVAAVMSRWPSTKYYSYGYGRVEILSGFINALFLIVIAFFIFLEALERLYDPPDISTDKLMIVAVVGLVVNIMGMFAFHGASHGHSHGGSDSHPDSHGHSHGHANANMQGVFLHVLADTLGSVFVIISTLLIQYFGWKWVDPLCSLILSMLILGSVIPLLKDSMATLMQNVPSELEHDFGHSVGEILRIEDVISFSNAHLWKLKSVSNVASIHVQVADTANEQIIRHRVVKLLKVTGVSQATVQVEKEAFFNQIRAINPSYNLPKRNNKEISFGHGCESVCSHSATADDGHSHHSHGEKCDKDTSNSLLLDGVLVNGVSQPRNVQSHGHSHDHGNGHGHSHS